MLRIAELALIAMVVIACPPDMPEQPADVVLMDVSFSPDTLSVSPGTTVVWLHDDGGLPHTVTSGQV
ncbi:MAG: hypothetical protein ACE5MM_08810, partial [Nitrospiraceae bacterium]